MNLVFGPWSYCEWAANFSIDRQPLSVKLKLLFGSASPLQGLPKTKSHFVK